MQTPEKYEFLLEIQTNTELAPVDASMLLLDLTEQVSQI